MALRNQVSPNVLIGKIADLPNPASMPQGYIFYADDVAVTFILRIVSGTGVRQWDPIATTVAPVITTVGGPGLDTTYIGGTTVAPTPASGAFAASPTTTVYEINGINTDVFLNHADPIGQRYEFYDNTGSASPNTTFATLGGGFISGPGGIHQVSLVVNVQGYWRSVTKMLDGNWLLSGL